MALPLEGLRIVDMTMVWAGPFGGMQLADLGAEVIMTESIHHGFAGRRGRPIYPTAAYLERTGGWFYPNQGKGGMKRPFNTYAQTHNYNNRNKLSMTVDLARPEGQEIFKKLVKISDGVVENQAARNMERFGLDYEDLKKVNPEIIMVRMPGFGITGPDKYRLAYGFTMDAIAGHTALRHYPGGDPITTGVYHGDACAGIALAAAFLTAVRHRRKTGKGQLVDIAQTEVMVSTYGQAFMDYFMNGRVQQSIGNRDTVAAPQGCYPCKSKRGLETGSEDTWWVLTVQNDDQWKALCRVMGRPELADDPRFADAVSRKKNEEQIDPILVDWAKDKDQYQIMYLLQAEGIPAGPVIDNPDVQYDPQVKARGHLMPVTHPEAGTHLHPGPVYRLSETPCRVGYAPLLGEHNEYVYKQLLGYSQADYDRLVEEKHIGMDFLPDAR